MCEPNFKILGTVVPEKSFDGKKLTHTQTHTHCYGKDENYILPIYFVCSKYNDCGLETSGQASLA